MDKKFHCVICDISFESGYGLSEHFRSKEHKVKVNFGVDSVVKKFFERFRSNIRKELNDDSKRV